MPPRSPPSRSTLSPSPKSSSYPQSDVATYRDLLLFEERLKSTAASLQRRKARYQLFLIQLLFVIAFLLVEVLLPPDISLIAIPCKLVLQRLLPDIYTSETEVRIHPYFSTGLLFVSVTTLALFFASGTYSDKIAYANKYVPHANKALRSFNMYLNVRQTPLRTKIWSNPLAFFFPRPVEDTPTPSSTPSHSRTSSLASTPTLRGPGSSSTMLLQLSPVTQTIVNPSTPVPIPPMPPTTNPRGELRFSSRVDRAFRDGYERYRANFERRRALHEQQARGKVGRWWWWRWPTWFSSSQPPNPQPPVSMGSDGRAGTPLQPALTITPASTQQRLAERRGTPPLMMGAATPANRIQTRAASRRQSGIPDLDDSGVLRR
ncbi:hypothetical protein MIND_01169300 [Mycena indigotica]|uniref:Transmembrane protein 188 n=1 Tax=Mycena indigotica TaxID=2126181 RepID=A0A8H6VUS0_9AGAR|nr:uncharacterized protein MIND_01169300 [Mycena indigotica]KAF7292711.1 hypothetical protein MIND_01169300 [Mycena indigotica]